MAFISPIYQVPFGSKLGEVDASRFSGEPTTGILAQTSGAIFFSPALLSPNNNNQIDLDNISIASQITDIYEIPPENREYRVFRWGPNEDSRTNDGKWRTAPKHYNVVATMVQTIPPGPTTIIKIP
jgi:hypothetical protein